MEIINKTEFPHFHYEKLGYYGELFSIITLSQTFNIPQHDGVCFQAVTQNEVVMADTWHGEPEVSSLRTVSDLVWKKVRADIFLTGSAWHADGPVPRWQAQMIVGKLSRKFEVSGPCNWCNSEHGWQLRAPEVVSCVPLNHELAPYDKESNPIGRKIPSANEEFSSAQASQLSASVGALCRSWPSRLRFAKGFTRAWQESIKPFYPDEFDTGFFNCAPQEQQYDGYLQGEEKIVLEGLLKSAISRTCFLPGLQVIAESHYPDHPPIRQPMLADTLTCDTDKEQLILLWRLTLPVQHLPSSLVLRTEPGASHG